MICKLALVLASFAVAVHAQDSNTNPGRDPAYWHDKYHGQLAMSTYNQAYREQCPLFFTPEGVQHNFPGSTEEPWVLLEEWGPTPKYGLRGFNVVMVFGDVYGWQRFNATPIPFPGIDCANCTVHAAAYEAYLEARNATRNWQSVRDNIGSHIWSSAGHGFGAMVQMVAALETNVNRVNGRGAEACHTFGAPPVFNPAAAQLFNSRFTGESSVRTVANNDPSPAFIPQSDSYQFTNMGLHVWNETDPTFSQSWQFCQGPDDARCHGGNEPADAYFYWEYTHAGTCGHDFADGAYNLTRARLFLANLQAQDANATAPLPTAPITSASSIPLSSVASTAAPSTSATLASASTSAPSSSLAVGPVVPAGVCILTALMAVLTLF